MTDNALLNELRDIFRYRHREDDELRLRQAASALVCEVLETCDGYERFGHFTDAVEDALTPSKVSVVPVDPYDSDEMPSE